MEDYDWSDDSALCQIEHGEPRTDRTESAFSHLEVSINGLYGDETLTGIALQLLAMVERLRHSTPAAK